VLDGVAWSRTHAAPPPQVRVVGARAGACILFSEKLSHTTVRPQAGRAARSLPHRPAYFVRRTTDRTQRIWYGGSVRITNERITDQRITNGMCWVVSELFHRPWLCTARCPGPAPRRAPPSSTSLCRTVGPRRAGGRARPYYYTPLCADDREQNIPHGARLSALTACGARPAHHHAAPAPARGAGAPPRGAAARPPAGPRRPP
jgi:hypothetical protein